MFTGIIGLTEVVEVFLHSFSSILESSPFTIYPIVKIQRWPPMNNGRVVI